MINRYFFLILFFFIGTHAFSAVEPPPQGEGGDGCGDWIDAVPPPADTVDVTSLAPMATAKLDELKLKVTEYVNSVVLDTDGLEKKIRAAAAGKGFTAERIAKIVSDALKEGADLLERQIIDLVPKAVAIYIEAYTKAIEVLSPKGKFQADLRHKERCCYTGIWTAGACNREGITQASGGFTISYDFDAGGAAGPAFLVKCKLEIAGTGGVSLEPFNPVRPLTGNGAQLQMKATPNALVSVKGGGSAGALLIFGAVAELGYRQVLEDISGTLSCK